MTTGIANTKTSNFYTKLTITQFPIANLASFFFFIFNKQIPHPLAAEVPDKIFYPKLEIYILSKHAKMETPPNNQQQQASSPCKKLIFLYTVYFLLSFSTANSNCMIPHSAELQLATVPLLHFQRFIVQLKKKQTMKPSSTFLESQLRNATRPSFEHSNQSSAQVTKRVELRGWVILSLPSKSILYKQNQSSTHFPHK